ncbi:gliotoxin biosynthesis protein GliK [Aspergillus steynii IBT 23096]|uniref:gamma-glutamylcyclotransferase n=1 Tax=Aspergillus steynii IBT 23096 TaxID=1392250 RepID=A0A2I2FXD5_9EURO|nr:gliotoxin biosynthesis protein GliK [Aspergillus steynii IBT 23096]PLB45272.1 gliotoxin biosynthesis protein GliK [Aspergillus steynii IBT 23096]
MTTPYPDSLGVEDGPRASRNVVLEILERLWELIPSPGSSDASSRETQCRLPKTTRARRRESIAETSLDKDEALVEKVPFSSFAAVAIAQPDEIVSPEKSVLYLAYGSNLAAETFLGKRGIKPLSQINVVVPDLRLTFDLPGLPYVEPCFAATRYRHTVPDEWDEEATGNNEINLETAEKTPLSSHRESPADRPLVGVVYEVTVSDYARIIATEGGGGGYQDIVVDCYPFADPYNPADPVPDTPATTPFKAHTLLAPVEEGEGHARRLLSRVWRPFLSRSNPLVRPHPLGYAQPSPRYLNLIVTGAAEHNLPVSYQSYLSQIQPYRATTTRQQIGKVVFLVVWGPFLLLTVALSKTMGGPDGRSPPWVIKLADLIVFTMWSSYDLAFARVFGDGERTVKR